MSTFNFIIVPNRDIYACAISCLYVSYSYGTNQNKWISSKSGGHKIDMDMIMYNWKEKIMVKHIKTDKIII